VFLVQRYGTIQRAQRGLTLAIAVLALLGIPLAFSFQDLVIREQTRTEINRLIRQETLTFSDRDIRQLSVQRTAEGLVVNLEVAAPAGSISETQVNLVQDFLERALARQIILNVIIIPVEILEAPAG
jgi:hypothetical protein